MHFTKKNSPVKIQPLSLKIHLPRKHSHLNKLVIEPKNQPQKCISKKNSLMKIQPLNQKINPRNVSQKKNSLMKNEPIEPKKSNVGMHIPRRIS
jgi:hypothetical protein